MVKVEGFQECERKEGDGGWVVPDIGLKPEGKEVPGRGNLGGSRCPLFWGAMGQRNGKSKRISGLPVGKSQGAMRDRKVGSGPALSDQDSGGRKSEELRCRVSKGVETGERKRGGSGMREAGGDWKRTAGSCGVSDLLPSSSSGFHFQLFPSH